MSAEAFGRSEKSAERPGDQGKDAQGSRVELAWGPGGSPPQSSDRDSAIARSRVQSAPRGARTIAPKSTRPDKSEDEEDRLLDRALARDQKAFGDLVLRYEGPLLAVLRPYARDAEKARDLVQETCLRAWRHLDRFDRSHRFSTWLFRIGINLAVSAGRRARLEARHREEVIERGRHDDAKTEDSPLHALLATEDGARLRIAIQALPDRQQEILKLRYLEGLKCQEIAALLGQSPNAISISLFRARQKLRELMEEDR